MPFGTFALLVPNSYTALSFIKLKSRSNRTIGAERYG
jgi:hypothetical protein